MGGGGYYRNLRYLKQAHGRRVEGGGFTAKGEAIAFSLAIICLLLTFFSADNLKLLEFTKPKWTDHAAVLQLHDKAKKMRRRCIVAATILLNKSHNHQQAVQGPVVQKPVNANLGLKVDQGFC